MSHRPNPDGVPDQEALLAHYDSLTRLPNRHLFKAFLEARINGSAPDAPPFGLLVVDIDRFKAINDLYGHRSGDLLIMQLAERLLSLISKGDNAARLSGDEFCSIMELSDEVALQQHCQTLQEAFQQPFLIEGDEIEVSVSIGAVLFQDQKQKAESLMKCAEQAMYSAKEAGRACYRLYDPKLAGRFERREQLAGLLHEALYRKREQFHVVYQPVVDLTDGSVVGFEALLRWESPDAGSVAPLEFVSIAEERHWMVLLTEVLITDILCDLAQWNQDATGSRPSFFSINISAQLFADSHIEFLLEPLRLMLQRRNWSLVLELTESQLLRLDARKLQRMAALRAKGVQIAIDDFGTGYSSLAYLQDIPVDILKLDQRFSAGLEKGHQTSRVSKAVVVMATSLGIEVIAEGIESHNQWQGLRNHACRLGQGFLFGRPQPWSEQLLNSKSQAKSLDIQEQ